MKPGGEKPSGEKPSGEKPGSGRCRRHNVGDVREVGDIREM